jgi:tyrosyl-tRNA synthetase
MESNQEKIESLLSRGVQQVIDKAHLSAALSSGKKLRIKLGIDPTGPDLHLGHAVVLWKLRAFQDLGHKIVFVIGDFTATIGDPSGRSAERPHLSAAEVKKNMKSYLKQAGMIINVRKAEVRYNSQWLKKLRGAEMMALLSRISVQQILEREDFAKRLSEHHPIRGNEMLYPVMQAYDSVSIKADLELGGNDQLLNLLTGRQLMPKMDLQAQDIMTTELLVGLDGSKKMSKSVGNTINLQDSPDDIFGKAMSLPDSLIPKYFELATDIDMANIPDMAADPKGTKQKLAFEIVKRYHGEKVAAKAAENWDRIFSKKDLAEADVPELKIKKTLSVLDLVMTSGVVASKSEARRLIEQGAVSVNEEVQKDWSLELNFAGGEIAKIGKRHFFKIKI